MKRIISTLLTLLTLISPFFAYAKSTDSSNKKLKLRIASFNTCFVVNTGMLKRWEKTKNLPMQVMQFRDFDICGAQEPYGFQIEHYAKQAPEYAYVEQIRGNESPEKFATRDINLFDHKLILPNMHNPIWYKKDKFDVLKWGKFWFSGTPNVPSQTWFPERKLDIRHCTWAEFKEKKSGKTFFVFNIHLTVQGHNKDQLAVKSIDLLLNKIRELADGKTVFVMGDFNALEWYDSMKMMNNSGILKNAMHYTKFRSLGCRATFIEHDGSAAKKQQIIDYIYVSKNVNVNNFEIGYMDINNVHPSDHTPIFADVEF